MMRNRSLSPNAYHRKAMLYRNRAERLAAIADDGKHPLTSSQLHQLSDDYTKLAHQMEELSIIERLLRHRRSGEH